MKVTVRPIVIGALGTIPKGLLKRLEDFKIKGQVEIIQTTTFLDWPEFLEESRRLGEIPSHSNSSEELSANAGVKKTLKREQ